MNAPSQVKTYHSLVLYLLVAMLCLADILKLSSVLKLPLDGFRVVLLPAEKITSSLVYQPIDFFQHTWKSYQTIQDLQRKNVELIALLGEADALRKENESLRQELEKGSVTRGQTSAVRRRVVGRATLLNQRLEIDQGAQSGIQVGDMILSQGIVIGQIREVSAFFSRASLLQTGNLSLSVQTSQGTIGVVQMIEGKVLMTHIPSDQKLAVSDRIFTLGSYDQSIPPNIPIGIINQINEHKEQSTKEAIVDQGIDVKNISTVMIEGY